MSMFLKSLRKWVFRYGCVIIYHYKPCVHPKRPKMGKTLIFCVIFGGLLDISAPCQLFLCINANGCYLFWFISISYRLFRPLTTQDCWLYGGLGIRRQLLLKAVCSMREYYWAWVRLVVLMAFFTLLYQSMCLKSPRKWVFRHGRLIIFHYKQFFHPKMGKNLVICVIFGVLLELRGRVSCFCV